jgi:hypothetical protein
MLKQYKCYFVFRKGTPFSPGAKRKGRVHWISATNPEDARRLMEKTHLEKEMRRDEWHEKTVASKRAEDVAMREQGQPTLFDLADE